MSKEIDKLIPLAFKVLEDTKISESGKIKKAWRGQIAAFGSAVKNGSILSAVAFFSAQGGSELKRGQLMDAIWLMLNPKKHLSNSVDGCHRDLFDYVIKNIASKKIKQEIINCAIAIKLAMNLYSLVNDPELGAEGLNNESKLLI